MSFFEELMNLENLPEFVLIGLVTLQIFLFQKMSQAHREHMDLRLDIAKNYPTFDIFERSIEKLEKNLSAKIDAKKIYAEKLD